MAEAEEVKTETVTVTLTEDTLAGLRLIAEHKGITVEEVIGRLASAAAKTAHTAKSANEKREEILAKISDEIDEMSEKKKELLTRIKAVKIDPDLGCEDWDKDVRETAKKLKKMLKKL